MPRTRRWNWERWTEAMIPDVSGRTFIVTGANSGIGLESARYLAAANGRVILACRNLDKARVAHEDIRSTTGRGELLIKRLDLASLRSIREFADEIHRERQPISVLMNNAGVFALDRSRTDDGFETHFGVNHLGHFALTGLLLPALLDEPASRVVTVSSLGHRAGKLDLDDPMFEKRPYGRWAAYFQSKLANLLFTRELHLRSSAAGLSTVAVSAHPGTARTEIGRLGSSPINHIMRRFMPVLVRDGVHGAKSQIGAAVDAGVQGGELFGPRFMFLGSPVIETPSRSARDPIQSRRLWEISQDLTGVTFLP